MELVVHVIGLHKDAYQFVSDRYWRKADIGTPPYPVMKMIGMSVRSTATRFCRSRPLRSGSVTSSTRQLGARTRGRDRNSCADANVSGCQPAQRISASSDSRTETSSSTTNTMGVACDMGADLASGSDALDNLMYIPQFRVQ